MPLLAACMCVVPLAQTSVWCVCAVSLNIARSTCLVVGVFCFVVFFVYMGVTALSCVALVWLCGSPESVELVFSKLAGVLVHSVWSARSLSCPADGFHFLFPGLTCHCSHFSAVYVSKILW